VELDRAVGLDDIYVVTVSLRLQKAMRLVKRDEPGAPAAVTIHVMEAVARAAVASLTGSV
jgi:hypothetical protein